MKNTLIFLITEGIGLNKKWKGNYLKLANKPNINYLISGIYPWAVISNTKKQNKYSFSKTYDAVKRDVDANLYEMLYGTDEIKTYNDLIRESIESQTLQDLNVFNKLVERAETTGSANVHLFSLLSSNENKFNANNLYFVINVLLSKGLRPIIHLIADGQDERPFNFNKSIVKLSKFLTKRHTPIATIVGRNHVFTKNGHSYLENKHVFNYFETLCGIGDIRFTSGLEYANENLANKIMDADIKPAYNCLLKDIFISKNDSVMFLNSDADDFSALASMIRTEPKFEGIFISSLAPIYGVNVDALFYENPAAEYKNNLITNLIGDKEQNALVLGLNHKKGFINKFFGDIKHKNVDRKAISTSFCLTDKDYYFSAPKVLIDKVINEIGKYDVIFVHIPTIGEAAKSSNLKDLTFAIETFDKNLGRLINFCRATGNIIAFTSIYGASEKMLDKHLNIVPYNKNSPVPFVFTNGDISSKKTTSSFLGIYASTLTTLNMMSQDNRLYYHSLINHNFSKDKVEQSLFDAYDVWEEEFALPLIKNFEETRINFYSELSKDPQFMEEKKQYVVLKELIKIHEKILLTPDARKKLFKVMFDYMTYNKIDFVSNNLNYKKVLETLFDSEINLQKISKISNKFFDKKIWNTNFKRNELWVNKTKFDLIDAVDRKININKNEKTISRALQYYTPFLFFQKIQKSEREVLAKNDAYSIIKFYELVKDEVTNIFQEFIAPRVVEDEEDKDEEQIAVENKIYAISSYFAYFNEVLDLVEENKDNAALFNKRYMENMNHLKEKNKSYDDLDLFERPNVALNPLVNKIITVYKFFIKDVENHYRTSFQKLKKVSKKYDVNYNMKHSLALKSRIYEGEFLEDVDMEKQAELSEKFQKHFDIYKEFDNVSMDVEKSEIEIEFTSMSDEVEYDEEGKPIVIDNIDKEIRLRPEYDLTKIWVEKTKEEYMNVDNIKANVAIDAEKEVNLKRKFNYAKEKVINYNALSESWSKKIQNNHAN